MRHLPFPTLRCRAGPLATAAAVLLATGTTATPLRAQAATVVGRTANLESGAPIPDARILLLTSTGDTVALADTDDGGAFRLDRVPDGRYDLAVYALGFRARLLTGILVSGPLDLGAITLVSVSHQLGAVVVTASREEESALDAPASVQTVEANVIESRPGLSVVDHLRGVPGVDLITTGVLSHNVVTRGFNDVSSGSLFELIDYRWAAIPSLRINTYNMIPLAEEDIERIEVVLGPGSALYGPNVDRGVLHIMTRSPLDQQGTKASLMAGVREAQRGESSGLFGRTVYQMSLRHAQSLSERAAFKVSGLYMQGNDWAGTDPAEVLARQAAIREGADPDTLLIGARDMEIGRYTVDTRLDIRDDDGGLLTFAGGVAHLVNSVELTPVGAAQGRNWTYSYLQARHRTGRFFAQAYLNMNDAGGSYLLRDGTAITDRSYLYVGQVQHGADLGERFRLRYGVDLIRSVPRTEGTISGHNEENDELLEVGGYLQTEADLTESLTLVLAGRADRHNRIEQTVFSPRAALVFRPSPFHAFRLTFNRAFSQPSSQSLFLDISSSPSLGPFTDFGVRATGVPYETGFHFRRDCGGLCMYSPFGASPGTAIPVDATPFWQDAVSGFATATQQFTGVPPDPALMALLRAADPTGRVGTVLRTLDTQSQAFGPALDPTTAVTDIDPLRPSITNSVEVGFKGFLPPRLYLTVDVYATRVDDFIAPLAIETPNAFLDADDLDGLLRADLEGQGLTPQQAGYVIQGLAAVPLGTVTPVEVGGPPTDLYVTVRNFGEVRLWGADVAAGFPVSQRLLISGSYSFLSRNYFEDVDGIADISMNAPQHKGSLGIRYTSPNGVITADARGRYVDGFDVRSGVFVGTLPQYTLVDLHIRYVLPFLDGTDVTVTASNLLNNRHREIIGAPEVGRVTAVRVAREF